MAGVRGLLKVCRMTRRTFCRGTHVTRCVAIQTFGGRMCSCKLKSRGIVVEDQIRITRRVTGQAGRAVKRVAIYTIVLVVCFGVRVAGDTSEHRIIRSIGVAVNTFTPLARMFTAVNGEILPIVVKGGRLPGIFAVAARTIGGKLKLCVVRIGCVNKIVSMAPGTVVRRIVVIAIVTNCTIVGDGGMRTIQCVKTVVVGKTGRIPSWFCRVTGGTVRGKSECVVVGVTGLVEIAGMAESAIRWSARIPCGMALYTFRRGVASGQRECCRIVVEDEIGITRRVAGETCFVVVAIVIDPIVLVIRLRICVAVYTSKNGEIRGIGVAVDALIPLTFVFATENGEILTIVVKSRGYPFIFCMASFAIRGELKGFMAGVCCVVKIVRVAPGTIIRCVVVIAVMARCAVIGYVGMCAI
jgi:hypothetical protein